MTEEKSDAPDIFTKLFGVANPKEGRMYDFRYAEVSNPRLGVIGIKWAANGFGFGEVTFLCRENGFLYIDTECMSDRFVNELLFYVVENSVKDRAEDGTQNQTPEDCYGSAANYDPKKFPTMEELCNAAEVVERLTSHHGLPSDGNLTVKLRELAETAYDKWFQDRYLPTKVEE